MKAQIAQMDINSYIDALLCHDPPFSVSPLSPEPSLQHQDTHTPPSHQVSRVIQPKQGSQELPEPSSIKGQRGSGRGDISKPKDYLKNMYNNSLKYIVKRYISSNYEMRVRKIHRRVGVADSQAAKQYYKQRQEQTIGLTNLCDLLDYRQGTEEEKTYKRAFHLFYVWFMRKCYPIHILTTSKLQHEEVYWRAKNVLVYLPELKRTPPKPPPRLYKEITSISLTQISVNAQNDGYIGQL